MFAAPFLLVALVLEKRKVEDRLRQLRDNDPDVSVRAAARQALERFAQTLPKE